MAVQTCVKPKMMDESDDDGPIVFRRSNTAFNRNHFNSETKKSSSQRHDAQSKKQVSEVRFSSSQNSISLKDMPVLSTKASPVKSPAATPKKSLSSAEGSAVKSPSSSPITSISSAKASPVKKLVADSKVSTLAADRSNHVSQQNTSSAMRKEKQMVNSCEEPPSDSEDSEDNKPLSARFSAGLPMVSPNKTIEEPNTSTLGSPPLETSRVKGENSNDEIRLSSQYQLKSNAGPSDSKSHKFDGNKPAAPKFKQNGSTVMDNQVNKSSTVLNKRPVAEVKSLSQSSNKRPKLVDGSSPIRKKLYVKAESKVDGDHNGYFPISERLQIQILSGRKPLSQFSVKRPKLATIVNKQVSMKAESREDEDDDDYVPISKTSTLCSPPLETPRVKGADSDDDIPLSSKHRMKSNAGPPGSQSQEFDESKPRAPTLEQNGSSMIDNQVKKSSAVLNKRPLADVKSLNQYPSNRPKLVDGSSHKKVSVKAESKVHEDHNDYVPISMRLQMAMLSARNSASQSSVKRPKLAEGSSPTVDKQVSIKAESKVDEDDDDDDVPFSERLKKANLSGTKSTSAKQKVTKAESEVDEDEDDYVPFSERLKKVNLSGTKLASAKQKATKVVLSSFKKSSKSKKVVNNSKYFKSSKVPPGSGEGKKWTTLAHHGVIFPPPYKPHGVKMLCKGQPVNLTPEQEEVATMFAVMLDTEYMTKSKFKENFMNDWRKLLGKKHVIQRLEDCDFTPIYDWHQKEKEKKKQMSAEEKKALKEEKLQQEEKYMWVVVDGVKEKVGNFRVEPPGLFRGRGEHPKMGKLKKRIRPGDITINIGKDAPIPECPIAGERWKEIRHDNTVTWLAFWNDPINSKEIKYVFLAASSSLKGQSDKEKYEKARLLKAYIQGIRSAYTKGFASKDITKRQIAVATYLIDKLALRAGNEKDDDEADTVGCCTLKVENVEPIPPNILKFDFLGKDSIRYQNEVEVELPVFKAIQQFRAGKSGGDDLFDKLDTSKLNAHLKELMPGLTAKVFRTYNASITLDEMLSRETKGGDLAENVVVYQHANKEVAIICNHQRTVSKSHSAQMSRLNEKIDELKGILDELKTDLARAKNGKPPLLNSADGKPRKNLNPEALERKIVQTNAKIEKMERDKETKEDLKTVALGTSKINYLDPRISVAWCKRHEVPIEKIFNKSLLAKFTWAMEVDPSFRF